MMLTESKIPKWKEREEKFKNQSFDDCLESLGTNGAFLNAKKISRIIISPTKSKSKQACEE